MVGYSFPPNARGYSTNAWRLYADLATSMANPVTTMIKYPHDGVCDSNE